MGFQERYLRWGGVADVAGWRVKQYRVTVADEPIAPEVLAAAGEYLPKLLPESSASDATPRLAFSVLHRGKDAVWHNLYSWCHGEILHCAVGSAPLAAPTEFAELAEPLIGCVWELPALAHERSAWVRHVLRPSTPDLDAYLDDLLPEGPVGGP